MGRQTVFPFKLKRTEEKITARSGLALFAEFFKAVGVEELVEKHMPGPRSGRGFEAIRYIKPLCMSLYGGGESIEDMREIREDEALREAAEMEEIPSSSAMGDWLKREPYRGAIEGMEKINEELTKRVLKADEVEEYTLIIDPTIIEAKKRDAKMTYLGLRGYRPVVATLKETPVVISYEFKEGNDNGGRLKAVNKALSKMPKGKKIKEIILDSEYYSSEVIEYLEQQGLAWSIAADQDQSIKALIKHIDEEEWKAFVTEDGIVTDRQIAETVHTMNKGESAFRLIVLRWQDRQLDLFGNSYHYHCIATSVVEGSPLERVWAYNDRAHIENHIKEIKCGFGMEKLPSGDFGGNALFFGIGILTYNLFIAQKYLTMPEDWRAKTIKSIRWLLVEVGAKLIKHGRTLTLKISASLEKYRLYLEMRRKTYALLQE
jgi:hypothetical protein